MKRNLERFPEDFMFQPTLEEAQHLRSQPVTLDVEDIDSINKTPSGKGPRGRGRYRKFRPFAFTEQGVAMLSTVLGSPQAIKVSIEIMRAFMRLRQLLQGHAALARKVDDLEQRYDGQFDVVFDAIRELLKEPPSDARRIGFVPSD